MGNLCSWTNDEHATEAVPGPAIIKQPEAKPQDNVKHCNDDVDRTS